MSKLERFLTIKYGIRKGISVALAGLMVMGSLGSVGFWTDAEEGELADSVASINESAAETKKTAPTADVSGNDEILDDTEQSIDDLVSVFVVPAGETLHAGYEKGEEPEFAVILQNDAKIELTELSVKSDFFTLYSKKMNELTGEEIEVELPGQVSAESSTVIYAKLPLELEAGDYEKNILITAKELTREIEQKIAFTLENQPQDTDREDVPGESEEETPSELSAPVITLQERTGGAMMGNLYVVKGEGKLLYHVEDENEEPFENLTVRWMKEKVTSGENARENAGEDADTTPNEATNAYEYREVAVVDGTVELTIPTDITAALELGYQDENNRFHSLVQEIVLDESNDLSIKHKIESDTEDDYLLIDISDGILDGVSNGILDSISNNENTDSVNTSESGSEFGSESGYNPGQNAENGFKASGIGDMWFSVDGEAMAEYDVIPIENLELYALPDGRVASYVWNIKKEEYRLLYVSSVEASDAGTDGENIADSANMDSDRLTPVSPAPTEDMTLLASTTYTARIKAALPAGKHDIEVFAQDNAGNGRIANFEVEVEPRIVVDNTKDFKLALLPFIKGHQIISNDIVIQNMSEVPVEVSLEDVLVSVNQDNAAGMDKSCELVIEVYTMDNPVETYTVAMGETEKIGTIKLGAAPKEITGIAVDTSLIEKMPESGCVERSDYAIIRVSGSLSSGSENLWREDDLKVKFRFLYAKKDENEN